MTITTVGNIMAGVGELTRIAVEATKERNAATARADAAEAALTEMTKERDSLKEMVVRLEEAIRAEAGLGIGQWHEEGRP